MSISLKGNIWAMVGGAHNIKDASKSKLDEGDSGKDANLGVMKSEKEESELKIEEVQYDNILIFALGLESVISQILLPHCREEDIQHTASLGKSVCCTGPQVGQGCMPFLSRLFDSIFSSCTLQTSLPPESYERNRVPLRS